METRLKWIRKLLKLSTYLLALIGKFELFTSFCCTKTEARSQQAVVRCCNVNAGAQTKNMIICQKGTLDLLKQTNPYLIFPVSLESPDITHSFNTSFLFQRFKMTELLFFGVCVCTRSNSSTDWQDAWTPPTLV